MCENYEGPKTCDDYLTCCSCGGNYPDSGRGDDWDCGCPYCWDCNACEECKGEEYNEGVVNLPS